MDDTSDEWPLGRVLAAAARAVERERDERLRAICRPHADIRTRPTSADQLARTAMVQPQTLSRTLERLECDGLVEGRAHAADRQRSMVTPTEQGRAAWETSRYFERAVLLDDSTLRTAVTRLLGKS